MDIEDFKIWLPTKTIDELNYIKKLVEEEIKETIK